MKRGRRSKYVVLLISLVLIFSLTGCKASKKKVLESSYYKELQKENKKLTELIKEQEADENLLNSFLKTAVQYGNQEAQIFLLQEKEALGGFQEKSWEL